MSYLPPFRVKLDVGTTALSTSTSAANLQPNPAESGGVVGGALPTGWFTQGGTGLTISVAALGNISTGIPYVDMRAVGTGSTTKMVFAIGSITVAASTQYTSSIYAAISAGTVNNITSITITTDFYNAATFLSSSSTTFVPTNRLTQVSNTATTPASTTNVVTNVIYNYLASAVIDLTLRIGGPQFVAASAAPNVATDVSVGNMFAVTLTNPVKLLNPTNLVSGSHFMWFVTQDGTGSRTMTHDTAFKWSGGTVPALSTAPGAIDIISATTDGTSVFCVLTTNFS